MIQVRFLVYIVTESSARANPPRVIYASTYLSLAKAQADELADSYPGMRFRVDSLHVAGDYAQGVGVHEVAQEKT